MVVKNILHRSITLNAIPRYPSIGGRHLAFCLVHAQTDEFVTVNRHAQNKILHLLGQIKQMC